MSSPCQNCPHRKAVCHDHCEEFASYHDALVEAKKSLSKAHRAIDFLMLSAQKRRKRARVDK